MAPYPELDSPYEPLVRRIETEATVIDDRILRIDHFLNHRIEPSFIMELGYELARRLLVYQPTVILTAEASGIAPGLIVAQRLNVPLVYAKKYSQQVEPPTLSRIFPSQGQGGDTQLVISRRCLPQGSRVVIVDDFLSNGGTAVALTEMAREAGAEVFAAGFIIEKQFRKGHERIAQLGVPVATLAQIERLENGKALLRQSMPKRNRTASSALLG